MATLNYNVPEAYADLFSPFRYKIYSGGRGSGKSYHFADSAIIQGYDRQLRILCAREIQKSIKDSVHRLLCDRIKALGLDWFYVITNDSIRGRNGTEFIFKGLHSNINEIKSTEGVDICWVEEAQSVSEGSWAVLVPTIRKDGSEIWISFNPLNDDDPTYKRFVVNREPEWCYHHTTFRDNPYFPETLRKEKDYLYRVDIEAYNHIWEGETRKLSGALIFKDRWSVEEFVTPNNARFYFGADWGFANDPTTLIRCFIADKCLYIDAEAYGVGVELDETSQLFDSVPQARRWHIWADNARPETISYMKRQGWKIDGAKKWQGSVEDGIAFLRGFEHIYISPRCKHTIDEFRHYSYKVDKTTNEILPIIVDADNHCIAKGTLIITDNGDKPIEQITTNDKVLTRKGYKQVLWAGVSDNDRVICELTTMNGRKLYATYDHRIYTERGFVKMQDLRKGDKLCVKWTQSFMTAENGTDTRSQTEETIGSITKADVNTYTTIFGKNIMVQEKRGIISIIKTVIAKITTFQTLKKLLVSNIAIDIGRKKNQDEAESGLQKLDRLQKNGIKAKKGTNGTRNTHKSKIGDFLTCLLKNVSNAAKNLSQRHISKNFVPITVKANTGGTAELTISQDIVNVAEKNLLITSTKNIDFVAKVVPVRVEKQVYDITVADCHEFYANGILVHNCIDGLRYALSPLIKGGVEPRTMRVDY